LHPRTRAVIIAPADQSGKVPEGSIDGRLGYEIAKISDMERQKEVAKEIIADPKMKGDRARLLVTEVREQPETPISEIVADRPAIEAYRPTIIMSAEDHEALRTGKKRILVERTLKPGLRENAVVDPLIKAEQLEIADVFRRPLGRFKDEDATSAGFKDLGGFKQAWIERHGAWRDEEAVYVILFKKF